MGVSLDSKRRIAGYRPAIFKNALRSYVRTDGAGSLIDRKSLFPLRRDGAIVFEECLDRGLIDRRTLSRTPAGEIIARAKAQVRAPLAKAETVLGQLLDRSDAMNADDEAIHQVDQIWLFGSLLRRQVDVGDIDLAILTSCKERYRHDHDARWRHARTLIAAIPDAPTSWAFDWDREDWLRLRGLYGPRRHPLLAGAQQGTGDLESLSVPCRLVYDRSRGGRVDDPILDRHPQSTGRNPDMDDPSQIPDLAPAPLEPMDGRWLASYDPRGIVSPYDIFRGWTDDAHRMFAQYPHDLRIAADGHDLWRTAWTPRRLKHPGLDGRAALLVTDATNVSGLSLVLNRRMVLEERDWVLDVSFSNIELHRARNRIDIRHTFSIIGAISLILAVDAERMYRRAGETEPYARIRIRIRSNSLIEEFGWFVLDPIIDNLRSRAIRIEPEGAAARVAIVKA